MECISLRELFHAQDKKLRQRGRKLLEDYFPYLQQAFPLTEEIETRQTYEFYLNDPDSTWDILILRDELTKEILGGIQYQILRHLSGETADSVAWMEHIHLRPDVRNFKNFRSLLKYAQENLLKRGVTLIFMEYNDPGKMTPEQILEDSKAGLATNDRILLWSRLGFCKLVDPSTNKPAAYAQPSMDGQTPVEYLSVGFFSLTEDLRGKSISVSDYLKIIETAHSSIPGVDVAKDPTSLKTRNALLKIGDRHLIFKKLEIRKV